MIKYLSIAQADTRYLRQLPVLVYKYSEDGDDVTHDVWDEATQEEKERALQQATAYIDSFTYDGQKLDPTQDKQFPRKGQSETPEEVKAACFELAIFFLREYKIREFADAYRIKLADEGYGEVEKSIGNYRERNKLGVKTSPKGILSPYLRKWLTGRFRLARFEVR